MNNDNAINAVKQIEIMVVDDTTANLKLLSTILTSEGYKVKVANSGQLALSAIALKAPDLILLDVVMPDIDGYEVCKRLKGDSTTTEIPVIFITIIDSLDEKIKAFQAGAVDYITKPFEEQEILARIKTHLELRKLRKDAVVMNEQLRSEICDKQILYDELVKAKEELEISYTEKWDSLANMAHEIRTPMNSILLAIQIVQSSELSEEQMELLTIAMTSSENLLNLLNDILDLSKINAKAAQVKRELVNLQELLKAVVSLFRIVCKEKGIDLELYINENVPSHLLGDSFRLRQVLTNLVGNAVKFTQTGFIKIRVDFLEYDGVNVKLKFSVADSGLGIPRDKQNLIFNRFQQADLNTSKVFGGTGLGLSISKACVEMMSGEIWVESAEGQGSVFTFTCVLECSDPHLVILPS